MIDGVVGFALQKLDHFITQEASLIGGVKEQFMFLHDELEWIKCFLKDADQKRSNSETLEVWVRQIGDLCYDVEDVIDAFILHTEQKLKMKNVMGKLGMKKLKGLHTDRRIAKQIKYINRKIEKITSNRFKYIRVDTEAGLVSSAPGVLVPRQRGSESYLRELDDMVFRDEVDTLAIQLTNEGEQHRVVISICGMGGLGKTTLANMVFNNEMVVSHFDIRAWISVSQQYQVKDLLQNLIKNVQVSDAPGRKDLDGMKNYELRELLSIYLQEKRYLVVVDDLWSEKAWDEIAKAFPFNKGSRIVVTTRKKEVSLHVVSQGYEHELALLSDQKSWDLFCKKVFNDSKGCPKELEDVGRKIVQKCSRLPLAIVVLGGLLIGREMRHHVWSNVLSSANWQLTADSSQCREVLAASYRDLPYYSKSCFLYLGLFPEDFEIPAEKLILLWVAEGFVQQRGDEEMEDVAEDCLEDLIQRSMIQVTKRKYNGRVETCRIHDLFRDLAISEGQKDRFLGIYGKNNSAGKARRLAFSYVDCEYGFQFNSKQNFRSLLFFSGSLQSHIWDSTFGEKIKMLRVLDLEGVVLGELSKEIGKLILLRYLGLRGTRIPSLPSSLRNLVNLLILDLRGTAIRDMPEAIWRMKQLRHLYGISYLYGQPGELNDLATDDAPKDLLTLQLTISSQMGEHLSEAIIKWQSLQSLSLAVTAEKNVLPRLSISNHQSIHELNLFGELVKDDLQGYFPSNLVQLDLAQSNLTADHMKILESLQNLEVLCLGFESYSGTEMTFGANGFTRLQILRLIGLAALEEWNVHERAMPKLRHLVLGLCPKLQKEKFPVELKKIKTLEKIDILSMPNAFVENLKHDLTLTSKTADYTQEGEWWNWSAPIETKKENLPIYRGEEGEAWPLSTC